MNIGELHYKTTKCEIVLKILMNLNIFFNVVVSFNYGYLLHFATLVSYNFPQQCRLQAEAELSEGVRVSCWVFSNSESQFSRAIFESHFQTRKRVSNSREPRSFVSLEPIVPEQIHRICMGSSLS